MAKLSQSLFDTPAYSGREAAHHVGVPYATIRAWISDAGVIHTPEANLLSFNNLAEAHVLRAMRKRHGLSLQAIRKALTELAKHTETGHPLLEQQFETDGVSLCIREEERVLNLNRHSQQEIREFVSLYLQRIERDATGRASRLYPFMFDDQADDPRVVSISPAVSFGRPVIAGTGISVAVIAGRFAARDPLSDLAEEYGLATEVVEDAIRWETRLRQAA